MGLRRWVQWASAIIHNAYVKGFISSSIYQGPAKGVCVPVLNCYSCPGALGSCPVGAMQYFLASISHRASLYILGLLMSVGAMGGRWVCGWLCPFGLIQELLAKLTKRKFKLPARLALIKYPVLVLTVALPVSWLNEGLGSPYYCKYICPAGTLEAGLPLVVGNPELAALAGSLFLWKFILLVLFTISSLIIFRPFCRTLCPLGAFYGLFNNISLWKIHRNVHACLNCGSCNKACPVDIDVVDNPNSSECIRCLRCRDACPQGIIKLSLAQRPSCSRAGSGSKI